MNRRNSLKILALGAVTPQILLQRTNQVQAKNALREALQNNSAKHAMASGWQNWPDVQWTGPDFWGNRLQDWRINNGEMECLLSAPNRSVHALTAQLTNDYKEFETSVVVQWVNKDLDESEENYMGFRLGAKGLYDNFWSAAVYGKGLEAGINSAGHLFIGEKNGEGTINMAHPIRLHLKATPQEEEFEVQMDAFDTQTNEHLASITAENIAPDDLTGNIALVAHAGQEKIKETNPFSKFKDWGIYGPKVLHDESQQFGPVCFAQYTLHNQILKLTAQLAPVEEVPNHKVEFQINERGEWKTLRETTIEPLGRIARFRLENWDYKEDVPYRVRLILPLHSGVYEYHYEGTIAREPTYKDDVKVAVFSCNADHGFPDREVTNHVNKHDSDLAVFLGDQFYEGSGSFGIQKSPVEKAALDMLQKWYMFGISYRDIFRHIPCAIIPDDHDVYHGNVWGEGGKDAPVELGWGYDSQDQGGYKMPPEWVNMVQRCQTSHLPDPYDPTPVKQDIGVYYTNWNYGGISFAIIEDRKFKSAPKNVLPDEAQVTNGFIQNRDFNIRNYYDIDADLLGERQMKFLNDWVDDWGNGIEMKAMLSQSPFCTVATLPEGSVIDSMVPSLKIPEPGEYIEGDAPTTDMDSNGWPMKQRDLALSTIRKAFAFHIAGDQHLASTEHYGVEEHGDAGFVFAGPALNNLWPRRWWPPVGEDHRHLPGEPKYTGDFEDGFGNKMTVHAVANPHQSGREPARIYNRGTGYGMVTFNKKERAIRVECWPRYADPDDPSTGNQYKGWPIKVKQLDNYLQNAKNHLPKIQVNGLKNPVIKIVDENSGELVYSLRIKGNQFSPKVYREGNYTIKVGEPDQGVEQERNNVQASATSGDKLEFSF